MPEMSLLSQLLGTERLSPDAASWPSAVLLKHGPLSRLPVVLRQPLLQDLEHLADRYKGPLSFGRGLRSPQTFDTQANAASLLQVGLTVFFQDLASSVPGASDFLRQLERELGVVQGSARLTGFASPADDGVPCHYDAEEVISIQLLGSKTFHIAPMTEIDAPYGAQFGPNMVAVENLYEQARDGFPDPSGAVFEVIEMHPGSALYLPRGTWHRTEAQTPSFSLSIVIRPPVVAEALLGWLTPWLLGDARWRLPLYGDADAQKIGLAALLTELAGRLTQDAVEPILGWSSASVVEGTDVLRVPTTQLVWDFVASSAPAPARLRLQVTALDQRWRACTTLNTDIPAQLLPALDWIQQRHSAFDLEILGQQLPQIEPGALRQLLELLIKSHALRRLLKR